MSVHRVLVPALVAAAMTAPATPALAEPSDDARAVVREERGLMTVLAGWSLGSVAAGTVMLTSDDRSTRFAGLQNVAWGAVDVAIAGYALATASVPDDASEERRRLARIFWINAALDVVYVAVGAALAVAADDPRWRGTGLGIATQGGFLLAFDTAGALVVGRRAPPRGAPDAR